MSLTDTQFDQLIDFINDYLGATETNFHLDGIPCYLSFTIDDYDWKNKSLDCKVNCRIFIAKGMKVIPICTRTYTYAQMLDVMRLIQTDNFVLLPSGIVDKTYYEALKTNSESDDLHTCWVCLDDCLHTEKTSCGHYIHSKCVTQYMQSKQQFQCGYCRQTSHKIY